MSKSFESGVRVEQGTFDHRVRFQYHSLSQLAVSRQSDLSAASARKIAPL